MIDSLVLTTLNKLSCNLSVLPLHLSQLNSDVNSDWPPRSSTLSYKKMMVQMADNLNEPLLGPTFDLRWKEYLAAAKVASETARLAKEKFSLMPRKISYNQPRNN